jgi:hypothetical protein
MKRISKAQRTPLTYSIIALPVALLLIVGWQFSHVLTQQSEVLETAGRRPLLTGVSASDITVGDTVKSTGWLRVRFTDGTPSLDTTRPGITGTVLAGPQPYGGYDWWQIAMTMG